MRFPSFARSGFGMIDWSDSTLCYALELAEVLDVCMCSSSYVRAVGCSQQLGYLFSGFAGAMSVVTE
jgi:hypothetical protein